MTDQLVNMITDYVLCALAFLFAKSLVETARQTRQTSVLLWAAAFYATALAAFLGGSAHGFAPVIGKMFSGIVWGLTIGSIWLAGYALYAAAVVSNVSDPWRRRRYLVAVATVLIAYAAWIGVKKDFQYVIFGYVFALILVLGFELRRLLSKNTLGAGWIVAGILISFAAALVQITRVKIHDNFNHNDLYHVIQIAGLYLLHRGGLHLKDCPDPSGN